MAGFASIQSKYGNTRARHVGGNFKAAGGFATVIAGDIGGDTEIKSSYGAVKLERPAGNVTIDTRYSQIDLILWPLDHSLTLEAKNGEITLKGDLVQYMPIKESKLEMVLGKGTNNVQVVNTTGNITVDGRAR